jgi:hypothetical protein
MVGYEGRVLASYLGGGYGHELLSKRVHTRPRWDGNLPGSFPSQPLGHAVWFVSEKAGAPPRAEVDP